MGNTTDKTIYKPGFKLGISFLIVFILAMLWKNISGILFLEYTNPVYYSLFIDNSSSYLNQYPYLDTESKNLLVVEGRKTQNYNGINVEFKDDGTIVANGKNTGDSIVYLRVSPSNRFVLHDGEYVISDGLSPEQRNGILFFYETRDNKGDHVEYSKLAILPDDPKMTIKVSEHDDFGLVLAFTQDFESEEPITIYPMVRHAEEETSEYEHPAILKSRIDQDQPAFQAFIIDKQAFEQLTDKDWTIFRNSLKHQFNGKFAWTSIIFEDGTGIQFVDPDSNRLVYGLVDPWGRLERIICEVHTLDEIKFACESG